MSQASKDTRSAAERSRDTAGIIGSFKHEGYVPNAEDEAIHQKALRGEITNEEAIGFFANAPFCESERRRSASVGNLASRTRDAGDFAAPVFAV